MSKSILHLDLHVVAKNGKAIDAALDELFEEAERGRVKSAEIIPGKGTGQLKKRILRFLDRKDIKERYKRIDKDANNHGRIFVHFR